jgi:hypothetical protein
MKRRSLLFVALGLCFVRAEVLRGQGPSRGRLVFDQAHGQLPSPGQLDAVARKLGLEIQTSVEPISGRTLDGARLLYLRAPSKEFTDTETEAIVAFVKGGGSLLLVLDEERRQSLEPSTSTTLGA